MPCSERNAERTASIKWEMGAICCNERTAPGTINFLNERSRILEEEKATPNLSEERREAVEAELKILKNAVKELEERRKLNNELAAKELADLEAESAAAVAAAAAAAQAEASRPIQVGDTVFASKIPENIRKDMDLALGCRGTVQQVNGDIKQARVLWECQDGM